MYLSRRLFDKGVIRATFSCLIAIDGAARLCIFAYVGLLSDTKLHSAYLMALVPMALGLYTGNKVHLDMTSEAMLKVIGSLLVLSGAMLFIKAAI